MCLNSVFVTVCVKPKPEPQKTLRPSRRRRAEKMSSNETVVFCSFCFPLFYKKNKKKTCELSKLFQFEENRSREVHRSTTFLNYVAT